MPEPLIEKLLILQERDEHHTRLTRQLNEIPKQIAEFEQKISQRREELEHAQRRMKDAEVQRKELEGRMADAEEQIAKFRNQQLAVKKNEEYTALEHEIENEQKKIGDFEERIIELMDRIEDLKDEFAEEEKRGNEEIAEFEADIKRLKEVQTVVESQLADAEKAKEAAAGEVEPSSNQEYQYVKTQVKRGPYVVPMREKQCQGCYLKVSAEAEAEVREGGKLVRCPNCKRILYADN